MSVAHLLEALGIEVVTPVPPEARPQGTDKAQTKQRGSLGSPCSPEKHVTANVKHKPDRPSPRQLQQTVDPEALLMGIAQTLQASPAILRALLDSDDMQDIAEGVISPAHLLAYFRQMYADRHPLTLPNPTK